VTVAAVILASDPAAALADADGLPRVRREADAAWAGGATPVVVVAADPDGAVAAALAGAEAILAEPAPIGGGPAGQIARGLEVAAGAVAGTEAALVWPARMAWVDPETVTSLIEAHGTARKSILRPTYAGEPGWPVVVPVARVEAVSAVAPDRTADDVIADVVATGALLRLIEVGDPGTVIDGETPRSGLPDYQGPPEPPAGHAHEWGAAVADAPEDAGPPPRRVPFESPG
jgi:CTP:molybdopterin cytidylyltransferase MocA